MNSKGLAPHPNLTNWLEKEIELAVRNFLSLKIKQTFRNGAQVPPDKVTLASD